MLQYTWTTFKRKFISKNFQKSPNLVTLRLVAKSTKKFRYSFRWTALQFFFALTIVLGKILLHSTSRMREGGPGGAKKHTLVMKQVQGNFHGEIQLLHRHSPKPLFNHLKITPLNAFCVGIVLCCI